MANEAEACEARRLWVAYLALDGFWSGDHACVAEEGQAGGMPGLTGGTLRAQAGTVRGEDYNFHFSGRVREGKLHFRLHMEYEGDEPAQDAPRHRTIDFVCAARAARAPGSRPAHVVMLRLERVCARGAVLPARARGRTAVQTRTATSQGAFTLRGARKHSAQLCMPFDMLISHGAWRPQQAHLKAQFGTARAIYPQWLTGYRVGPTHPTLSRIG